MQGFESLKNKEIVILCP